MLNRFKGLLYRAFTVVQHKGWEVVPRFNVVQKSSQVVVCTDLAIPPFHLQVKTLLKWFRVKCSHLEVNARLPGTFPTR